MSPFFRRAALLWLAAAGCAPLEERSARPRFPVKIGADRRTFVDQADRPIFWLGTTQWELCRRYTPEEAQVILERTRAHGFTFVQMMVLGVGDGTGANFAGEKPWLNDDPLTPNEAYFRNVDAVLARAGEEGLAVAMTMYHQRYRKHITVEKARRWARWLAERYRDVPNLQWAMHPQAKMEYLPVLRELAAGLEEGDGGRHLVSAKPDPSPFSSSFIHGEEWLDFNTMQTWKDVRLIHPMVTKDYGLSPTKPVVMGEGAYEAGTEYGFPVTPLWVRRQAYYSYLAGAHHAYGHNDSWRVLPTWRASLDAPGAVQMGVLRKIFEARSEWWRLVPDQAVLAEGGKTEGAVLRLSARHPEGRWAMVYLAEKASFSVDPGRLQAGPHRALWIDPRTGEAREAGAGKSFSTPEGWEDAILILEAGSGG